MNALNQKALQYAVIQYCPAVSAMSADVLSLASFLEREREVYSYLKVKKYIIIAEVCLPASIIIIPRCVQPIVVILHRIHTRIPYFLDSKHRL